MRVLICDDAGFIRQILRDIIFEKKDVTIFEATNGNQAIEIASSVRPEIVFLDLVLPQKNGVEVAKVLKAEDQSIKIIGISTLDREQIQNVHDIRGLFDQLIEKPFSKAEIEKALGF